MKKILSVLCLAAVIGPVVHSQELTKEDRSKAIKYLEKTRADVIAATKGLSDAQWNFKPGPDRWSIAEVTEHIAAAEDYIMGAVRDKVMASPARTEAVDTKALDAAVLNKVPDRSTKAQAPEPLRPTNRYGSGKASLEHFEESRAKTIEFMKTTKGLREHAMDNPIGQKLDAYQWILFIAAHSERHTKQIQEVKADPHYPKS